MSLSDEATLRQIAQRSLFTQLNSAALQRVLQAVNDVDHIVSYHGLLMLVCLSISVWDALSAFNSERRHIWAAKRSATKVLHNRNILISP